MATLETQDTNILDADAVNWRLIAYPLVGLIVVVLGGLGIYYYLQGQRQAHEALARQAFLQAKTAPAQLAVADQYPGTTHGYLALLSAGKLSFDAKDYAGAMQDYQRAVDGPKIDPVLHDSAELGLASSCEAADKVDDALNAYLAVARRGNESPYAPFAYSSAARLDEQKNDKVAERQILTEAAALDPDSAFVKQASERLKALNLEAQTPSSASALPGAAKPAPVAIPTH